MKLYDVYPLFDINIVKGQSCKVWDDKGQEYLDLYGGHAVISIGHCHPHYVDKAIDLKQVVNTNKCLVHVDKYGDKLLITSCIDNLLKGAVGQAVQNMNIMFGLDQTAGLKLKPSAF